MILTPTLWVSGVLPSEVKWLGHEVVHSSISSDGVRKAWNFYLHTTYILIVWFIIKDKEHFFPSISSCRVLEKLVFAGPPFQDLQGSWLFTRASDWALSWTSPVHSFIPYILRSHFNITIPSMSWSPIWVFATVFNINILNSSSTSSMFRSSSPPSSDSTNNSILYRVNGMKFLLKECSWSC